VDKTTIDTFGRTWTSNAWFYDNKFFCIGCRQPIPTWFDDKRNRNEQLCNHKRFATGEVIKMEGKPASTDFMDTAFYVDALAGSEVRSCFVADSKADCVVGCHRTCGGKLKLYCGGEVLTEDATVEQMAVLFDDLFRQEFGGASIEDLI
jgi:hypothetical protein